MNGFIQDAVVYCMLNVTTLLPLHLSSILRDCTKTKDIGSNHLTQLKKKQKTTH